jgi:hypothetical protein
VCVLRREEKLHELDSLRTGSKKPAIRRNLPTCAKSSRRYFEKFRSRYTTSISATKTLREVHGAVMANAGKEQRAVQGHKF